MRFLKEFPDKFLAVFVLIVLLCFYARFQTTFFEQAILFILGVVGGMLRGAQNQVPPQNNVENLETKEVVFTSEEKEKI